VEEEADGGDAGGSGGEAGGCVSGCDSAEGENGDVLGGFDGCAEGFEALAGKQGLAVDGFFEDRRVQNECVVDGGVGIALRFFPDFEDFFAGVARVADHGVASCRGKERAGVGSGAGG